MNYFLVTCYNYLKLFTCQCNLKRKYIPYTLYRTISTIVWVMLSIFIQGHGEIDWDWYDMIVVSLIVFVIWRAIKKTRVHKLMCIISIF